MNRGYTVEKYEKLVHNYRDIVHNGRLTTDLIVGFPTETKADYNATKSAMTRVRFDGAYIFKYSPRPPAASAKLEDDVAMKVKKARNVELLYIQKRMSRDPRA